MYIFHLSFIDILGWSFLSFKDSINLSISFGKRYRPCILSPVSLKPQLEYEFIVELGVRVVIENPQKSVSLNACRYE